MTASNYYRSYLDRILGLFVALSEFAEGDLIKRFRLFGVFIDFEVEIEGVFGLIEARCLLLVHNKNYILGN